MSTVREARLPWLAKLAYAMPAFAMAVVGIPVYVYIPKFYTDVVGVDVLAMGVILFSVRLFDALTDPALGHLSDITRTRFGRRRPYIAAGAVILSAVIIVLFNPPRMTPFQETVWFVLSIYALFLFWTVIAVPYESLGPEMTFDYGERVSLFGWRDGFLIAGTLTAAVSPAVVRWLFGLPHDGSGERAVFFWVSVIYAPLIIFSAWWCVWRIRERQPLPAASSPAIIDGLKMVSRNRPFVVLLIAYTVSAIGNNLPATLILYYVEYVLLSNRADLFLILYFVTGIAFLPVWIRIAQRTGKKQAWLASMALNTGAFAGVFFLGPGDEMIYGILVCLSGIGFGATLAIPSAIQADVIDYDQLLTGHRREGQYIGLWSIAKKMAAAVGTGVGLAVLGMAGYEANAVQSEPVRLTLRVLYAAVPSVFNILAIGIAWRYPIDRDIHAKIRNAIAKRENGEPVFDPLQPASRSA